MGYKARENVGKPVGERRRLEPTARRAQLLEHAISAFAEAGIERAVHANIAARARVSTPTVFKYFPTREALVDAVLEEVENAIESLQTHFPADVTLKPSELVKILSMAVSEMCSTRPDVMKVVLIWSAAFSPVRQRYSALEARMQEVFLSVLGPNILDTSDLLILFSSGRVFIRMHFDEISEDIRNAYVQRISEVLDSPSPS